MDEEFPSHFAVKKITKKMKYIRSLLICLAAFDIIYLLASFSVVGIPGLQTSFDSTFFIHLIPYW